MSNGTFGFKGFKDRALEFPAGATPQLSVAVSPSGRARIRYNDVAKQLEQSIDGEAYTPLGGTGAGPWDQVGTNVFPDSTSWNVIIGASATIGSERLRVVGGAALFEAQVVAGGSALVGSEALRVVGTTQLGGDIKFDDSLVNVNIEGTQPAGHGSQLGLGIDIICATGQDNDAGPPGNGNAMRTYGGRGGDATSGSDNGAPGGRNEVFGGQGGGSTGAGTQGGGAGYARIGGGKGGTGSSGAAAGDGGYVEVFGGQGGTGSGGDGGEVRLRGGSASPGVGTSGNGGDITMHPGTPGQAAGVAGNSVIRGGRNDSGTEGKVIVADDWTDSVEIGNVTDNPPTDFFGTGVITFDSQARIDPSDGGSVWGATSRDASALVQIDSTTDGFLPPRMTRDQRNLIGSPATGLEVHNTSRSGSLDFYDGTQWREVAPYIDAGVVAAGGSYSAGIDELVRVNSALGSPTTVTLPTAVGAAMRKVTIKETAGNAGTINVNTTGGQSIDGNVGPPADTFAVAYGWVTYISDGSNWIKFS